MDKAIVIKKELFLILFLMFTAITLHAMSEVPRDLAFDKLNNYANEETLRKLNVGFENRDASNKHQICFLITTIQTIFRIYPLRIYLHEAKEKNLYQPNSISYWLIETIEILESLNKMTDSTRDYTPLKMNYEKLLNIISTNEQYERLRSAVTPFPQDTDGGGEPIRSFWTFIYYLYTETGNVRAKNFIAKLFYAKTSDNSLVIDSAYKEILTDTIDGMTFIVQETSNIYDRSHYFTNDTAPLDKNIQTSPDFYLKIGSEKPLDAISIHGQPYTLIGLAGVERTFGDGHVIFHSLTPQGWLRYNSLDSYQNSIKRLSIDKTINAKSIIISYDHSPSGRQYQYPCLGKPCTKHCRPAGPLCGSISYCLYEKTGRDTTPFSLEGAAPVEPAEPTNLSNKKINIYYAHNNPNNRYVIRISFTKGTVTDSAIPAEQAAFTINAAEPEETILEEVQTFFTSFDQPPAEILVNPHANPQVRNAIKTYTGSHYTEKPLAANSFSALLYTRKSEINEQLATLATNLATLQANLQELGVQLRALQAKIQ
jgi:hypothetical protein